jgi:YidC/Oxa1 family membrane protein insertase
MGMDKNTVIGFVLIGVLLIGMFYFNSTGNQAYLAEQKRIEDSIAKTKPKIDTLALIRDSINAEAIRKSQSAGIFQDSANQSEQLSVLENDVIKVTFTNKGGQPKHVELKKYKTFDNKPVVLLNGAFNKISYAINSGNQRTAQTSDLTFTVSPVKQNTDKSAVLTFSKRDSSGKEIIHQFVMRPESYLLDFNVFLNKADQLITQNSINLLWQSQTPQIEKDLTYEKQQSHIGYLDDGNFDFEMLGSGDSKTLDKSVEWVAIKQQFFVTSFDQQK